MTFAPDPDRLRRLCVWYAVVALGLGALTMASPGPHTVVDSFLDGGKFVASVAAAICGLILVIEMRVVSRAARGAGPAGSPRADALIIDLRDGAVVASAATSGASHADAGMPAPGLVSR